MNVLITQRHTINKHGDWIDSLENNYIAFFESFGLTLIPVSNTSKDIDQLMKDTNPSGIILSGGGDVDPELYGRSQEGFGEVSKARDKREASLLEAAIKEKIPVLGICRGMQFINVHLGGALLGNIGDIDPAGAHAIARPHMIEIADVGLMELLGGERDFSVNSYHKRAVLEEGLGKDLGVFAVSVEPGLVEGIYHEKYQIAGIQWHPERKQSAASLDKVLMNSFINRELFWSDRN